MEAIDTAQDTMTQSELEQARIGWATVLRDVLVFQFKLVVDGLKDLCLAQVAVGAALIDLVRSDGSPGRRFYGIVSLSDRFDRWLDLHEALNRTPDDVPDFVPPARHSVDDLIDGLENGARVVAERSADASERGLDAIRRRAGRRGDAQGDVRVASMGSEAFEGA